MKLFERFLPEKARSNVIVYNITVVLICVALFVVLFFAGGILSVFLAYIIDTALKARGQNIEIAIFAVILLLILASIVIDLVICIALLLWNIKWENK